MVTNCSGCSSHNKISRELLQCCDAKTQWIVETCWQVAHSQRQVLMTSVICGETSTRSGLILLVASVMRRDMCNAMRWGTLTMSCRDISVSVVTQLDSVFTRNYCFIPKNEIGFELMPGSWSNMMQCQLIASNRRWLAAYVGFINKILLFQLIEFSHVRRLLHFSCIWFLRREVMIAYTARARILFTDFLTFRLIAQRNHEIILRLHCTTKWHEILIEREDIKWHYFCFRLIFSVASGCHQITCAT